MSSSDLNACSVCGFTSSNFSTFEEHVFRNHENETTTATAEAEEEAEEEEEEDEEMLLLEDEEEENILKIRMNNCSPSSTTVNVYFLFAKSIPLFFTHTVTFYLKIQKKFYSNPEKKYPFQ